MLVDFPTLLKYEEAARHLGVAEITLRKWVSAGRVPYTKIGRYTRFTLEQLREIVAAGSHSAKGGPR